MATLQTATQRHLLLVCNVCWKGLRDAAGRRAYSVASSGRRPIQVAIIGSGPAGFYSAYRLLKKLPDARISMFEQLPVPYGLARYGVAPDHPEVKKCTETLNTVASESPHFHFAGNVPIGNQPGELPLTSTAPHFDAVLFAYGAGRDKRLGIPGEDLKNVVSARAFVGWYNGLPECADLNPDLQAGERAVIIGQGNVALDVVRILLSPLEELKKTDINSETLDALATSKVRDVKVIGRRGPLQAPYTIKELRELMNLSGVGFAPPPETWGDLFQVPVKKLPRQLRRIAELLQKGSMTPMEQAGKGAWQLGYLRSPAAFLSTDNEKLEAVGFEQMAYAQPLTNLLTGNPQSDLNALRAAKVQSSGKKGLVHASLAFRSVGYQSCALEGMQEIGVPFDASRGVIPNDRYGRVIAPATGAGNISAPGEAGAEAEGPGSGGRTGGRELAERKEAAEASAVPGMYCAGWVKRGPTGVIASTLDDAFLTADVLAKDWEDGKEFISPGEGTKAGWDAVSQVIKRRGIRSVSWAEWEKIDAEEVRRGKEKGKAREKINRTAQMLKILDS